MDPKNLESFIGAVTNSERIGGLTHDFYNYPARFSPLFVREAINAFTEEGDVVLDPFMGSGTTLVEARTLGRISVGADISELSCFIAKTKTTFLSNRDCSVISKWFEETIAGLNLHSPVDRPEDWIDAGYQRNLNSPRTWRMRKAIELVLDSISKLQNERQAEFARAVVLRTGQWAFESRKEIPTIDQFRTRMFEFAIHMLNGAVAYRDVARAAEARLIKSDNKISTIILNRSAVELSESIEITRLKKPKLIVTSPPYPGVHVLYHRWQIHGRKETPAPFWIANAQDGNGTSFYTFGNRQETKLKKYFETAEAAFKTLVKLADEQTLFVQLIAFSDADWQLPQYLECMESAGLEEISIHYANVDNDDRIWRNVPNRRWYANRIPSGGSKEVVLFHRIRK
jgi:DNA modification methylase